jgi:cytidyltransferase-like protein
MKKIGLVLGRFQPPHSGHREIVNLSMMENDETIICIGSSQKEDPLSSKERCRRIRAWLKEAEQSTCQVIELVDPEPISIWVNYVIKKCGITSKTINTYYHSDHAISEEDEKTLKKNNFQICKIKRKPFNYLAPDGKFYLLSSATEIRELHKRLNVSV